MNLKNIRDTYHKLAEKLLDGIGWIFKAISFILGTMYLVVEKIGPAALVISVSILATIYYGWVLSTIWGWFAVPIFGLPALGIVQSVGVGIVFRMLAWTTTTAKKTKSTKDKTGRQIIQEAVIETFGEITGFLIAAWIMTWFL